MNPKSIAGEGYSDDFNEGNNTFEYATKNELNESSSDALGAGNRRGIKVLDRTSGNPTLEAKIIVEEIGHNIGFLHKDEGIMNETLDEDGYSTGNMTRKSLQSFVNRLEGMTNSKSSSDYWKNSKEAKPYEETTGTTRVKGEN